MKDDRLNENLDRKLRQYFYCKGEKIDTSEYLFSNIESELKVHKKKFSLTGFRVIAVAAVISVIFTVAAFGEMNSVKYYSCTVQKYTEDRIDDFGKKETQLDFIPKYVTEFDNGYKLKEINITDTFGIDELNFKCDEKTNVEFLYEKDDKKILLKAHKKDENEARNAHFKSYSNAPYYNSSVEDVPIKVWQMERKYVPNGYTISKDDDEFINSNILDLEFGASEISVEHVFVAKWVINGIEYCLYNNEADDGLLDKEVIRMSKNIINN